MSGRAEADAEGTGRTDADQIEDTVWGGRVGGIQRKFREPVDIRVSGQHVDSDKLTFAGFFQAFLVELSVQGFAAFSDLDWAVERERIVGTHGCVHSVAVGGL